jgi:hypothetical protein
MQRAARRVQHATCGMQHATYRVLVFRYPSALLRCASIETVKSHFHNTVKEVLKYSEYA